MTRPRGCPGDGALNTRSSSAPSVPPVALGRIQDGAVQLCDRAHNGRPLAVQPQGARSDQANQSGQDIRDRTGRSADPPHALDDVVALVDGGNGLNRLHGNALNNSNLKRLRLPGPPVVVGRLAASRPAIDAWTPGDRRLRQRRSAPDAPGRQDPPDRDFLPDAHAPKVRQATLFRHRRNSERLDLQEAWSELVEGGPRGQNSRLLMVK